jgi:thiol:disulfide interchange protein DsbD
MFLRLVALICVATLISSAQAQQRQDLVRAELIADTTAIEPGVPFQVAVRYTIAPEWHIYWTNPGDGGLPTTVSFDLPEGFSASEVRYPTPRRFVQPGDIEGYGYESEVVLFATITPPQTLPDGPIMLRARSVWLVCRDVCLPGKAEVDLTLPVGAASGNHDTAEVFARWTRHLPASGPALTLSAQRQGELSFEVPVPEGASDVFWFPPPFDDVTFTVESVKVEGAKAIVTTRWQVLGTRPLPSKPGLSVVGYGPADDRGGIGVSIEFAALPSGTAG